MRRGRKRRGEDRKEGRGRCGLNLYFVVIGWLSFVSRIEGGKEEKRTEASELL